MIEAVRVRISYVHTLQYTVYTLLLHVCCDAVMLHMAAREIAETSIDRIREDIMQACTAGATLVANVYVQLRTYVYIRRRVHTHACSHNYICITVYVGMHARRKHAVCTCNMCAQQSLLQIIRRSLLLDYY